MKTLLTLAIFAVAARPAAADCTKAELIKMHKAGLGDDVIEKYILAHLPMEKLTCDDLIELKAGGVSAKILVVAIAACEPKKEEKPAAAPQQQTIVVECKCSCSRIELNGGQPACEERRTEPQQQQHVECEAHPRMPVEETMRAERASNGSSVSDVAKGVAIVGGVVIAAKVLPPAIRGISKWLKSDSNRHSSRHHSRHRSWHFDD